MKAKNVIFCAVIVAIIAVGLGVWLGRNSKSLDVPIESASEFSEAWKPGDFTRQANAGVPRDWEPLRMVTGDLVIDTPGAVVEDLRIVRGTLLVRAADVTVRRVAVQGGVITNAMDDGCYPGLVVEDTSLVPDAGQIFDESWTLPALGPGGYTARRVLIDGLPEGFRVSGTSGGCGPVVIEDSFARVKYPDVCGDWHGDALQGYDGAGLVLRRTTLILEESPECGGTAPLFYPDGQGNAGFEIEEVLVVGGGFAARLGTPGVVHGLYVAAESWQYGPIDVKCSVILEWHAYIVTTDEAGKMTELRNQPCDTEA